MNRPCSLLVLLAAQAITVAQDKEVVERYPDGGIKESYRLDKKGQRSGPYLAYFPNGSVRMRARYRGGTLDGTYERFHDNGKLALRASYTRGKLRGSYEERRPDGKRILTATYREGVLHGKLKLIEDKRTLIAQEWRKGQLINIGGIDRPFLRLSKEVGDNLVRILSPPDKPQGEPKEAERAAALRRLKAYRYLCSLPHDPIVMAPELNELCDAAGEVCDRLGRIDHFPPDPGGLPPGRYEKGRIGCGGSNLAGGGNMVRAVDSFMDDSDSRNRQEIGHRRWCLNPTLRRVGFGRGIRSVAMWVKDSSGRFPKGVRHVFYPPRGACPSDMFAPHVVWSITFLRGLRRKGTKSVRIQPLDERFLPKGKPLETEFTSVTTRRYGGGPCLIFRPRGLVVAPGRSYLTEVSLDGGKSHTLRYLVAFTEPVKPR